MTFPAEKTITSSPTMVNSSILQDNTTQALTTGSKLSKSIRWVFILSIIIGFTFFLFFITLLLNVFFKTPGLRENARYLLFVFLLLNDTLYLLLGLFLLLAAIYLLRISVPLCSILYTLSSAAYKVTPYNLGAMALEQYVAICHPLRHVELCTTYRACAMFTIICSMVMIPHVAELYVMASSMAYSFNLYIICQQENLVLNPIQNVMRPIIYFLCITSVLVVIIFTYVKIMQVAKRASTQSSFASKAGKTVMIHCFQLLLYSSSLLSVLSRQFPTTWLELLPLTHFFTFTCLPRFLSPLIYGIRDELLRQCIKKYLSQTFC